MRHHKALLAALFSLLVLPWQSCSSSPTDNAPLDASADFPIFAEHVRSALYPADWTPGFHDEKGRGLSDFSYAGYKNSEAAIPDTVPGQTYDVVAGYGADPTGAKDATAAIQAALTAAANAGGGVVLLPAGLYRCDGMLDVQKSGVVVRGAGPDKTKIYFTKSQGMSNLSHLTMHGTIASGPSLPLTEEGADQSFEVRIADSSSLSVGDDISVGWVITPDFVAEHQMTGTWTVFLNLWKPFFRRKIVSIDRTATPHRIKLDVPLRYAAKLRDQAAVRRETGYITGCGVESLSIANAVAWADAWKSVQVHAIGFNAAKDCWIRNVQSFAPPTTGAMDFHLQNGGIVILNSKRFTVTDVTMQNAQNRGDGGCGYLYEIQTSNEVLIRDSIGRNGRHNFVQNWDFGSTGLVFLRCQTSGGAIVFSADLPLTYPAASEYHHSLTMSCLVDSPTISDSWAAQNRLMESSGAGHTATNDVFWNAKSGPSYGSVVSYQYGMGYVIGTTNLDVQTTLGVPSSAATEPEDYTELVDQGARLDPPSLFEDQLSRRMTRGEKLW